MLYLVVGGSYTPPSPTDIQLQLGDDPLLQIPVSVASVNLSSITVAWDYDLLCNFNPQADALFIQRSANGTDWQTIEVDPSQGQYTDTGLLQGNRYWYRSLVQTTLYPTPKQATSSATDGWTDFLITVQSCKDSEGNTIANAVILALPEEELLEKVPRSATGTPLPSLSYRKVNKTDQNGQCNIRIPGGKGKVWVIMIPPMTTIAGHARAHLTTQEE